MQFSCKQVFISVFLDSSVCNYMYQQIIHYKTMAVSRSILICCQISLIAPSFDFIQLVGGAPRGIPPPPGWALTSGQGDTPLSER